MLEEFIRHKTEIIGTIENIESLTKDDMGAADNRLLMVKEQLLANCFNLVILGQFKRGKTTLINSLIGKEILPSSVVPLTSIVTILKYGEEVRCLVSMDDGNEKKIRIEELSDYVTEKGNPKNIRGVRCARIAYPSPFLEKGILLVDTPRSGVHLPAQHRNDLGIPGPSGCGIVPHERRRPYLAGGKRTPRHD